MIAGDSEIVPPGLDHKLIKLRETLCPLNGPTISGASINFMNYQQTLLIDTGANKNLIKISKLQGGLIINEQNKGDLKGINPFPVETIGTIDIVISIEGREFPIRFDVIFDDFPINRTVYSVMNFWNVNPCTLILKISY